MKRRDIKVGMAVDYRLAGGQRGKHLGVVTFVGAVVVSYRRPDGSRGIATPAELMPANQEPGAEPMTADGIRITTQAQADAVPNYSRGLWPDDPNQWFVTPAAPRGYLATNTYMLTHVAMPVDRAAADRDEAFADAKVLRNAWDALSRGAVNAIADRVEARARRALPDPLADAYQEQQRPPTVTVELPLDVAEKVAHWATPYNGAERVVVDAVRAALDAERGQE